MVINGKNYKSILAKWNPSLIFGQNVPKLLEPDVIWTKLLRSFASFIFHSLYHDTHYNEKLPSPRWKCIFFASHIINSKKEKSQSISFSPSPNSTTKANIHNLSVDTFFRSDGKLFKFSILNPSVAVNGIEPGVSAGVVLHCGAAAAAVVVASPEISNRQFCERKMNMNQKDNKVQEKYIPTKTETFGKKNECNR